MGLQSWEFYTEATTDKQIFLDILDNLLDKGLKKIIPYKESTIVQRNMIPREQTIY